MKEVALAMHDGRDVVLGSVEQAVLAKWMLKTALVIAEEEAAQARTRAA